MSGTKICCACDLEKDKERDFSVNRANPDGKEYICKSCKSTKAKSKRRQKKIYLSPCFGFDENSIEYYVVKNCEVCADKFYPMRPSHKRCIRCSYLVRDTQSHLSASRPGNHDIKTIKCSVEQAVQITRFILASNECSYCKRGYTELNPKSIDHVVPVARGGDHDTNNINICCLQCNLSKRDLMLNDWFDLCRRVADNFLKQ